MTEPEFETFFYQVYGGVPGYAKKSIQEYLATGVVSEILMSDAAANKAEQNGIAVPAAGLIATGTKWPFVFRPFLGNAPNDKLRAIIQHEIVHVFLISVELRPNEPAKGALTSIASASEHSVKSSELSYLQDTTPLRT